MQAIINEYKNLKNQIPDLIIKKTKITIANNLYVIYLETVSSADKINEYILKNIINNKKKIHNNIKSFIAGPNTKEISEEDIFNYVSNGFAIILFKSQIIAVEVRAELNRSISLPNNEPSLTGPKDAFTENYQINIGLIKRRIKDKNLINDTLNIGSNTKTSIGVLYLSNLVNKDLLLKIYNIINSIKDKDILDSRDLSLLIENNAKSYFPTIIKTERPDIVCKALLEGKIIISVDNSCYALIMPAYFIDFINPKTDDYSKGKNINFIKILRLTCFFISLLFPAIYISLINYNQETIPTSLLINFSMQRNGVPFPAVIEAFLMIILCEILRESDLRFPNSYGSAISILGALIIGEAAVSAGIVSPIMIIVIAITFITSLIFTEYELINALRHYRFLFLISAAFYGIFGIVLLGICFLTMLNSIDNYTNSYLFPFTPYKKKYFYKLFLKKENKL